jgi:hypothetical protein
MNALMKSKDEIFDLKNQVQTNAKMIYNHVRFGSGEINDSTVSIVMTSCNRSQQVYYTLKTISLSEYKNIQIIIVDDSTSDPIEKEKLAEFPFIFDFIQIDSGKKCWQNPVVNYNIGFRFVEGGKVIIQNSEVCHVNDVVSHVVRNLQPNTYYVYDVRTTPSYEANEAIYTVDSPDLRVLNGPHVGIWYQARSNNRKLHFLTAVDRIAFEKIGGFSYDYSYGSYYDDDDFLIRIASNKISIVPQFHDVAKCAGIHLFHGGSKGWNKDLESNHNLYLAKFRHYKATGIYLEISESPCTFEEYYERLKGAK